MSGTYPTPSFQSVTLTQVPTQSMQAMPLQLLPFGTNPGSLTDLITSVPSSAIYQTAGADNLQVEPILGPFYGKDFTRAQSYSALTTTFGSGVAEYAHLFNMHSVTGYPQPWVANTAYLKYDTVYNGGNMYYATTAGTSAASGGPTGTGTAIADGTVVWTYTTGQPSGQKTNVGVFTYVDANSTAAWGIANDLQLTIGTNKVNAFTMELDLNNYRMDYKTGPVGPAATALQFFIGGPHRSSTAISIAGSGTPTDAANLVYGIDIGGTTLVSDADVLLQTSAAVSLQIGGTHTHIVDATGATLSGSSWKGVFSADTLESGGVLTTNLALGVTSQAAISGTQWQTQGVWFAWNYGVSGESDFINSHGGAAGGFNFYNVASSPSATPTLLASLDSTGALAVGAGAATINSGTGAPTATRPAGSLFMRTDGATGSRLYVSAGGGTWTPVPGV